MAKKKAKSKSFKRFSVANQKSITSTINNEVIAEALSSGNQPVLLKVCRLCESKDGPFLNIFDSDKVTAKKIEELMPFVITENDDLPHKICFRCSAKVVELHEFIQRCVKTQENLRSAVGQKGPGPLKTKTRKIWEQKLNKSNMSNDDICDALIKKAMESIKDIPLNPVSEDELPLATTGKSVNSKLALSNNTDLKVDQDNNVGSKELKLTIEKCDERKTRSLQGRYKTADPTAEEPKTAVNSSGSQKDQHEIFDKKSACNSDSDEKESDNSNSSVKKCAKEPEFEPQNCPPKFNIMDHVSKITVNGVGILFQCKLCNRNFLKKDVVLSHDCAKKGKPKVNFSKQIPPPDPPKVSTVKYIKMDADFRKSLSLSLANDSKTNTKSDNVKKIQEEVVNIQNPVAKPKPRVGPASKVKRMTDDLSATVGMTVRHKEPTPEPAAPTPTPNPPALSFAMPSQNISAFPNTSFKLVIGPNNILTLVADKPAEPVTAGLVTVPAETVAQPMPFTTHPPPFATQPPPLATQPPPLATQPPPLAKRKLQDSSQLSQGKRSLLNEVIPNKSKAVRNASPNEDNIVNKPSLTQKSDQPYPVGLFQTMSHHSSMYVPPVPTNATFTTSALKKQSYKVVPTGNPSKLLISTKSQPEDAPTKKRQRKSKQEMRKDLETTQPYSVTLEDASQQKDAGFFTFINVDPLLQPSYVLPTDNIIQESQITTSTPAERNAAEAKDKYSCNMCGESFSREKKLLAHIQSHFSKMDQEDQEREKSNKKRVRK